MTALLVAAGLTLVITPAVQQSMRMNKTQPAETQIATDQITVSRDLQAARKHRNTRTATGAVQSTVSRAKFTMRAAAITRSAKKRLTAMHWAVTQKGKPYCWGGNGPSCYDCSGLVVKAYKRVGIALPRTTGAIWSSSKTRHISKAKAHWGDLVMWFSGGRPSHVEFLAGRHLHHSFGAHHSGTRIGYRSLYGTPHYLHVVGAG